MSTNMQLLGKLELALLLQMIGLLIVVIADSYLQKKQKRILLLIALLAFSLLVRDRWDSILTERPDRLLRTLLGIYGYGIRPVILVLYLKTLEMNRSRKLLWCLVAANAAIYFAALFKRISLRWGPWDTSDMFCARDFWPCLSMNP